MNITLTKHFIYLSNTIHITMVLLFGFIGLLIIQSTIDARRIYFSDNVPFNPCGTLLDVFFYAHPVDPHLYYQCDESGTAYERSCNNLVWDDVAKACNWANPIVKPTATITEPTIPFTFTTQTTFPTTPFTFTTQTTTVTPFTFVTRTTASRTPFTFITRTSTESPVITFTPVPQPETTFAPVGSLCQSNPCGEHGRCIESSLTIPVESRRFACICDEDYIGRLCDKRIDEVRRVQVPLFDQSTPSTNIESVTDTSTVSSMEIIKENPEIILGGFSGILPANFQNRFEGNRRTGNRMVSS